MIDAEKAIQGKVQGVIIPPPEIRAVVDKTAQFVAKNGKTFEQRILSSNEGKTAKFNFMKEYDPYHAYYEFKIREIEEAIASGKDLSTLTGPKPVATTASTAASTAGSGTTTVGTSKPQVKAVVASSAKAALVNPIAKLSKIPPKIAPYSLEFSMGHPSGVNAVDIDVIKLTAQYTAVNGREFLAALATKEQHNPQFDFLKPTHLLFSYFTTLVDAYAKIVHPSEELKQRVQERTQKNHVLEYAVHRWNWKHSEEERKREEEKQNDVERLASQGIDWYDFTVVEVIEFAEDELLDIPGIANIDLNKQQTAPPPPPMAPMAPPKPPVMAGSMPPPPPPPASKPNNGTSMQIVEDDEDDEKIKVVSNYQPRITSASSSGATSSSSSSLMMLDPVTGKPVPVSQLEEHMRIQLLDPKWKEEQKRYMEKQKETGYAEGASIADSLKIFAKKRGDIFGQSVGTGNASAASIAEEESKEKKKFEEASSVQWDGYYGSAAATQQLKSNLTAGMPEHEYPMSNIGPTVPAPTLSIPTMGVPPPPPMMTTPSIPPPPALYAAPPMVVPMPPMVPPAPYGYPPMAPPVMPSYSMPPPPVPAPPSYDAEESKLKKPRTDDELMSADAFAQMYPQPISVKISVPEDSSAANWNFNGQSFSVDVMVTISVKDLKEMLSSQYLGNIPTNKLQLKSADAGFLKDANTLATLNIRPGTQLDASVKSRGGKK